MELSIGSGRAQINFTNGIAQAISAIRGAVSIAGVGGLRHQHANPLDSDRRGCQLKQRSAALSVRHRAAWKCLPHAQRWLLDWVFAGPILHQIFPGIRLSPSDPDRVDILPAGKIEKNPLRMKRIVLARECLRQVWIAFPICILVAVAQARVANHVGAIVVRHAAMRQRIAIRMAYQIPGSRAAREITFAPRIAPCAGRIPMPRFHVQLGILAVRNGLPARRKNLLDHRLDEKFVSSPVRQPVDSRAERACRNYRICGMFRRCVHADRLPLHGTGPAIQERREEHCSCRRTSRTFPSETRFALARVAEGQVVRLLI